MVAYLNAFSQAKPDIEVKLAGNRRTPLERIEPTLQGGQSASKHLEDLEQRRWHSNIAGSGDEELSAPSSRLMSHSR